MTLVNIFFDSYLLIFSIYATILETDKYQSCRYHLFDYTT